MPEGNINWDWEISKKTSWYGAGLKEVLSYKELIFRLVRKDTLVLYQQTLLGPFWILVNPIITVITYILIFNKVIGLTTDGLPPLLFYLSGITLWNLFSEIFISVASTFSKNAHVFSKVYYPRIIAPLSSLLLNGFLFSVNLLLLIAVYLFYLFTGQVQLNVFGFFWCLLSILMTSGLAFGAGLIVSILSARYKDLMSLLNLMIRMLMFICPVFYSLQLVPAKLKWLVLSNPLSIQFELFRFGLFNKGTFSIWQLSYSFCFALVLLVFGIAYFNKKSDELIDVA
jgi:lipopolysaccharide transport system permease protein